MLIDSPYFPDELEALPALLARAGFEPDGLLATHADFDHLLGRLAFPGMTLGLARARVERLHARARARPSASCATYDAEYYVSAAGAAGARAGAGAAGAGPASSSATASWSCTPPRATRPTAWRCSTARRAC